MRPSDDVDVAIEDAVEGVVDHVVKALEGSHDGDLRHAEPGAEARQPHVAAVLLRPLIHRLAHDAEVGLRGERAAVALGGRSIGDVIEQALRGRADDGDDVPAGLRDRLGVHDILVYVACRREHVTQRRGRLAQTLAQRAPLCKAVARLLQARTALLEHALADRLLIAGVER